MLILRINMDKQSEKLIYPELSYIIMVVAIRSITTMVAIEMKNNMPMRWNSC